MSYEIANQLDLAADFIEQVGWTTGGEHGVDDPWHATENGVCLEGALAAVLDLPEGTLSLSVNSCRAGRAVREFLGYEGSALWGWNDATGRTEQEVLDALRGAAKYERMKEDGLV